MEPRWRLTMLGGFRADPGNVALRKAIQRKNAALLAYLAYHRGTAITRDALIERLWPDSPRERAGQSLRVAINALREFLEPPGVLRGSILVSDGPVIRLNAEAVATDIAEFEDALIASKRAGDPVDRTLALKTAVDLYTGVFLGPELDGAFSDDTWITQTRGRIADDHIAALISLAGELIETGDLPSAVTYAARAVESIDREAGIHPSAQEAVCLLMRALEASGQCEDAADRCANFLRRMKRKDPAFQPGASLRAAVGRLRVKARAEPSEAPFAPVHSPIEPNLPHSMTPFFGREVEISAIQDLLMNEGARLVTVTGAGGSGKTRVCIEAARGLAARFEGGVYFVELTEGLDPGSVIARIRSTLGLTPPAESDNTDPEVAVRDIVFRLRSRPVLLVLDNFDALVDECAIVVKALLDGAPSLRCLVTSRERLRIPGERRYPLDPLPTPGAAGGDAAPEFACVRLFVDRASAVAPDFSLTPSNARTVAALCSRLEGLPLAIELAAGLGSTLSPAEILSELDHHLDLLQTDGIGVPSRHRSLRAAVDGSYERLSPEQQRVFHALSIFHGGWTLDAATYVCCESETQGHLAQLHDRSLITTYQAGGHRRYRMLDTIRHYAAGHLAERESTVLAERHAAFYTRLAQESEPILDGPDAVPTLTRLDAEADNMRAALTFHLASTDGAEAALRLASALFPYYLQRNEFAEGKRWLEHAIVAATDVPDPIRAKALCAAGALLTRVGESDLAAVRLSESAALYRALGDERGTARALFYAGLNAYFHPQGYAESRRLLRESLGLFEKLGDTRGEADALEAIGSLHSYKGDNVPARVAFSKALAVCRTMGDTARTANALRGLGQQAWREGNVQRAEALLNECLPQFRDLNDRSGVAFTLTLLGNVVAIYGDAEVAESRYQEASSLYHELADRRCVASVFQNMAMRLLIRHDPMAARRSLQEALLLCRDANYDEGAITALRDIAIVLSVEGCENWAECAARLLGYVERRHETVTSVRAPIPVEREDYERALDALRAALTPENLAEAWKTGRGWSELEAVEAVLTIYPMV